MIYVLQVSHFKKTQVYSQLLSSSQSIYVLRRTLSMKNWKIVQEVWFRKKNEPNFCRNYLFTF